MSLISSVIIRIIPPEKGKILLPIMVILTLIISINSLDNVKYYSDEVHSYFKNDLGHQSEYLPVNTRNNYYYFENRSNTIEIVEGKANIEEISNNTPSLKAIIELETEEVTLELPRIYYLGYKIQLIEDNNKKIDLKYYENENGFITINVPQNGTLVVKYRGTILDNIAHIISIMTTILFIIIVNKNNKKLKEVIK
jgi:hypothetical protein